MYISTLIWAFEGLEGTALDKLSILHICSESTHPPLSYLWMCLYLCTAFVEKIYLQTVKKVHSWKYMHVCNNLVLDIGTSSPTTSITSLMHISSTAFHILNCRKVGIFRLYEWVIESQYPTDSFDYAYSYRTLKHYYCVLLWDMQQLILLCLFFGTIFVDREKKKTK